MAKHEFHQDRYLRATGYNFYSWGLVNLLVTIPAFAALGGAPWNGWLVLLYTIGLIAAGVVVSVLNDRYVEKMCGEAAAETLMEAGAVWLPILVGGLLLNIVLSAHHEDAYVQPLWMVVIGAAYQIWGLHSISEYKWLGRLMMTSGAVAGFIVSPAEVASGLASRTALYIWIVIMGVLWLAMGVFINRKYIHQALAGSTSRAAASS